MFWEASVPYVDGAVFHFSNPVQYFWGPSNNFKFSRFFTILSQRKNVFKILYVGRGPYCKPTGLFSILITWYRFLGTFKSLVILTIVLVVIAKKEMLKIPYFGRGPCCTVKGLLWTFLSWYSIFGDLQIIPNFTIFSRSDRKKMRSPKVHNFKGARAVHRRCCFQFL